MRSRAAKIVVSVVGGAIALGVWAMFAPTKVGGSTTYSITSGISMQPMLHENDLAFVRPQSSYHVGEVVLYQSPVLHKPVLHRIILIQHGNYFFQGDNNSFVDPGYATRRELVGELWFSVPAVGGVLAWIGTPAHAALLAGLATMLVVLAGITTTTHRRGRRRRGSPTMSAKPARTRSASTQPSERSHATSGVHTSSRRPPPFFDGPTWSLASLGVVTMFGLLLLAVGFGSTLHRVTPQPGAFRQAGTFSYSAAVNAPNAVYPTGVVTTGQPIYPSLVDQVTLRFGYQFTSALPHHVSGTIELRALVLSQTDTWQEVSTVVPITDFTGDKTSVSSDLPLAALYDLVDSVSVQSGIAGSSYSVDIQPVVHIVGSVGGNRIRETFSPVLPFAVTHTAIRVDVAVAPPPPGATYIPSSAGAALASTLHPTQLGGVPHVVANEISVAKYKVPVSFIRVLGVILAVLALVLALVHDRLRRRQAKRSVEERIASQLHTLIVPVASLAQSHGAQPIAVPDFTHLAGLARYLERPILYEVRDGHRTFAVDDDTRRYVTAAVDRRGGPVRIGETSSDALAERAAPSDAMSSEAIADLKQAASAPSSRHRSLGSILARGGAALVVLLVGVTLTVSLTASTTVPASRVGRSVQAGQVSQAAPAACASLSLTSLVLGSGTFSSSSSHALILGTSGVDRITADGSFNCIVGGAGKDVVTSTNSSVCIIGPTGGTRYTSCTTHS